MCGYSHLKKCYQNADIDFTQDKRSISVASVNVGFITDTEIVFILGESMSQV